MVSKYVSGTTYHIHENGWLSGSIYINVPKTRTTTEGNLVIRLDEEFADLEEESGIQRAIDVSTGMICLFPASLYHYTTPFKSKNKRIVLAFDVVPDK